jgi:hypothetical protein
VTVWRAFSHGRPLAYQTNTKAEAKVFGEEETLLQDVFCWQVREDVWSGLADEEVRIAMRQRFLDEFQPTLPPSQRTIRALTEFIAVLEPIACGQHSEWADSAMQEEEDESRKPYRLNPLLAFHRQLTWIRDVFVDIPGASVSVR